MTGKKEMTENLKKIVGSLLVLGFDGPAVTDSLKNFLTQWDLGGIILFKRNIESLEQVAGLNRAIYQFAEVPPIVSVDHEGGRVFRLPEPFTAFPPMRRLGDFCEQAGDCSSAEAVGRIFGRELRAVGFNLDYAPVLDVDSNPQNPIIGDRAFGSTPGQVAEHALAFWRGLESERILGCGKHFPGHGDTAEDSHLTLPRVEKSLEQLNACELIPFHEAIGEGISMLMTAHVLYPALDPDLPATLSPRILTGLLRERLGYQGMIISDDLLMKGIVLRWGLEDAAERFLRADGDLVLLCHDEAAQRRVAAHLVHQAEKDADFQQLLEAKAKRMEAIRKRLTLGVPENLLSQVGSEAHRRLADSLV